MCLCCASQVFIPEWPVAEGWEDRMCNHLRKVSSSFSKSENALKKILYVSLVPFHKLLPLEAKVKSIHYKHYLKSLGGMVKSDEDFLTCMYSADSQFPFPALTREQLGLGGKGN